jgi:hypothetical protein
MKNGKIHIKQLIKQITVHKVIIESPIIKQIYSYLHSNGAMVIKIVLKYQI